MKKLLSIMLSIMIAAASIPAASVSALEYLQLPAELEAPKNLYVAEDQHGLNIFYAQSKSALEMFMNFDKAYWGDSTGGNNNTNYWNTPYGLDYHMNSYTVQIDWKVDGGDWQYTDDWDTLVYADNSMDYTGLWNSYTDQKNYAVINKYSLIEGNNETLKKCFTEKTDESEDKYYLFDSANHTIDFRIRYAAEVTHSYSQLIFSDWSETVSYGKTHTYYTIPKEISAPEITGYEIISNGGYADNPVIKVTGFSPSEAVVVDDIVLNYNDSDSAQWSNADIIYEYRLDSDTDWTEYPERFDCQYDAYNEIDLFYIWKKLFKAEDASEDEFSWDGQDVQLRSRIGYSVSYIEGENTEHTDIEIYGDYSDVIIVKTNPVSNYKVNITHQGTGFTGDGSVSYNLVEGSYISAIYGSFYDGCYIEKVTVNGEVYYDKNVASTYNRLEWSDDYSIFSFIGDERYISKNLDIVITYSDLKTGTYPITVSYAAGGGEFYFNSEGNAGFNYETQNNEFYSGYDVTLEVRSNSGYVIKSIVIDGAEIPDVNGLDKYSYTFKSIDKAHNVVLSFTKTSVCVNYVTSGNGSLEVISENVDEQGLTAIGNTVKIKCVPEEGHGVIYAELDGEEIAVPEDGIFVFENVSDDIYLYVGFSTSEVVYHNLTINCHEGGTIDTDSTVRVESGTDYTVYFYPEAGYEFDKIVIGSKEVTELMTNYYTIENITSDTVVDIYFKGKEQAVIYGDVTNDSLVNMSDVVELQKAIAGIIEFSADQKLAADVDGNPGLSMNDVVTMQRFVASIIDKFPVEEG